MAKLILIAAPSGSGKSTSLRNLNPKETFIIKPNSKPLPFVGAKKSYSTENKNVFVTTNLVELRTTILSISEKATHIKNIVVDDWSHFLMAKSMQDANKPGFQKFMDLGKEAYDSTAGLETLIREDINLIILTHSVEDKDVNGMPMTKLKLTGKFVEEKVDLPSYFTYVLEGKVNFVDGKPEYKFLTNKRSEADMAKTPMGVFEDLFIDNDIQMVLDVLEEKE